MEINYSNPTAPYRKLTLYCSLSLKGKMVDLLEGSRVHSVNLREAEIS